MVLIHRIGIVVAAVLCFCYLAEMAVGQSTNMGPMLMAPTDVEVQKLVMRQNPKQKGVHTTDEELSVQMYRELHNPKVTTEHWKARYKPVQREMSIYDQIKVARGSTVLTDPAWEEYNKNSKLPNPLFKNAVAPKQPKSVDEMVLGMMKPNKITPPRNEYSPELVRNFPRPDEMKHPEHISSGFPAAAARKEGKDWWQVEGESAPAAEGDAAAEAPAAEGDAAAEPALLQMRGGDGHATVSLSSLPPSSGPQELALVDAAHAQAPTDELAEASSSAKSLGWDDLSEELANESETMEHVRQQRSADAIAEQHEAEDENEFLETAESVTATEVEPWWKNRVKVAENLERMEAVQHHRQSLNKLAVADGKAGFSKPVGDMRFMQVGVKAQAAAKAQVAAGYAPLPPMFHPQNPDAANPVAWKVRAPRNPYALTTLDIMYPDLKPRLEHAQKMQAAKKAIAESTEDRRIWMKLHGLKYAPGSQVGLHHYATLPNGMPVRAADDVADDGRASAKQPVVVNVVSSPAMGANPQVMGAEMAAVERMRLQEKEIEMKVEQQRTARDNRFLAAMTAIAASTSRGPAVVSGGATTVTTSTAHQADAIAPMIPNLAPGNAQMLARGVYPPNYYQPAYVPNLAPALTPSDASQPSDNGVFGDLRL